MSRSISLKLCKILFKIVAKDDGQTWTWMAETKEE
jgi:hypothetical protein